LIYKRGNIFWIKYYRNGKPYCESSHSKKESAAKTLLKSREGQIADGKFPGLRVEKILFDELAQLRLKDALPESCLDYRLLHWHEERGNFITPIG